jgi:hypothetical protein
MKVAAMQAARMRSRRPVLPLAGGAEEVDKKGG